MKTAIIDIDGTISDGRHRLHFVRPGPGEKRDNAAFHSRCGEDPVIPSMIRLVHSLADYNNIVLCTGRPDTYREATMDWLDNNAVPYDELHMKRPDQENTPAVEYKLGVLRALQAKGHDVFLAIEDQASVVAMWRANGVHCLQTVAI
jgi:uncharacterized HAD superfamily protein